MVLVVVVVVAAVELGLFSVVTCCGLVAAAGHALALALTHAFVLTLALACWMLQL